MGRAVRFCFLVTVSIHATALYGTLVCSAHYMQIFSLFIVSPSAPELDMGFVYG